MMQPRIKTIKELNGLLNKGSEAKNDAELSCRLAKLYFNNGDRAKAEEILKRLIKNDPKNVQLLVECANCYVSANIVDEAEFLLEKALDLKTGYVPAYLAMAEVCEIKGDAAKQISFLMLAANAEPDKYEIRLIIAEQLKQYGDLNGAISQYKAILENKPGLEIAIFSLGSIYLRQNNISEATDCFKKILNNNPTAFDAHFNLANCYFRKQKYALAVNHFNFAMRKQELVQRSLYLTAQCWFKTGDVDRAVVAMEKLCELDGYNVPYKKCLAEFYETIKEYDMAIDTYEQLCALAPERAEFCLNLARNQIKIGELKSAEKTLKSMFLNHPGNLEGHKILGELLASKKQYKDAVEEYMKILMFNDKYPGIYKNMAKVYRETENYVEEQKALQHAVAIGEEEPELLLRLGELERKMNLPLSVERFRRITEIAPESSYAKEAAYYLKYAA